MCLCPPRVLAALAGSGPAPAPPARLPALFTHVPAVPYPTDAAPVSAALCGLGALGVRGRLPSRALRGRLVRGRGMAGRTAVVVTRLFPIKTLKHRGGWWV